MTERQEIEQPLTQLEDVKIQLKDPVRPQTATVNEYDLIISEYIENKPDLEEKEKEINNTHARKDINGLKKPYLYKDICCKTRTGSNCCGGTSANSSMDRYGVGVTLYFKFVKTMATMFAIFSLCSLPITYRLGVLRNSGSTSLYRF